MPGLIQQLHGWLEEVRVKADAMVEPIQPLEGNFGGISIIAHNAAHHIPILLLHMAAIILLVGPGPCEGNLIVPAILVEALVDELAAIVRVYAEQGKRKTLPHVVY